MRPEEHVEIVCEGGLEEAFGGFIELGAGPDRRFVSHCWPWMDAGEGSVWRTGSTYKEWCSAVLGERGQSGYFR